MKTIESTRALGLAAVSLALLTSCSSDGESGNPETAGTGGAIPAGTGGTPGQGATGPGTGGGLPQPVQCSSATDGDGNLLILTEPVNNYSFASTLSIPPAGVKPNSELSFDWSGLSRDFLSHPVNATADVQLVALVLWTLNIQELQQKLNDDALSQQDVVAISTFYPQPCPADDPALVTCQRSSPTPLTGTGLLGFTAFGSPLQPEELLSRLDPSTYDPANYSYTVMAAASTAPGQETRMIKSFVLDPSSSTTEVVVADDSTTLDFTVDLQSLTPVGVPRGTAAITFDWEGMTVNAMGHAVDRPTYISDVVVSRYTQTPAELQERFLDLDLIAEHQWTGEVETGTSITLSDLTDSAAAPFPGVDDSGTFLIALRCGRCNNPAPWYLTFLVPCAG